MVQLAATKQITRAVLLAGDSDFVPAVEAVKQNGVLMVLWHGPLSASGRAHSSTHRELWGACDDRFEITSALVTRVQRGPSSASTATLGRPGPAIVKASGN